MRKIAPLGIVVYADLESARYPEFWSQDCSAATQNLLLAAHTMGLGAVWLGVYPIEERVTGLKHVLNLPESVIPLSVVPLGYPATMPEKPVRRYNQTRLHYNYW